MPLTKEEKQRRAEERRQRKWNETHKTINGILHKICTICDEWKPSTSEYFYKNKANSIDGLHPYCKPCAIRKNLTQRDPQRTYELNKFYRQTREFIRESTRRSNKRRLENGQYKEWQQNNPEKIKQYRENRLLHKEHTISHDEWESCKKYFSYKCAYCGISEEEAKKLYGNQFHKEHVDHNGVNDLSNCVPACKSCNGNKYTFEFEDWYNENNERFTYERLNKITKWLEEDYKLHIKPVKPKQKYTKRHSKWFT